MEPVGTPTPAATPTGVLAAQDAIIFSGAGAEGVTPPAVTPTATPTATPAATPAVTPAVTPAAALTSTDIFRDSLAQVQRCVWELLGAMEGQPDSGHRHPASRDAWHCREDAFHTPGGEAALGQRCGSASHQDVPADGSISAESMAVDENIWHEPQGRGSAYRSIPRRDTEGTISPRSLAMDESIFHEHHGRGFRSEGVSHVSMGSSVPNEDLGRVPAAGSTSPGALATDGSSSPMSVPLGEAVSPQHVLVGGTILPKATARDETNSPRSVTTDGSVSPECVPKDGTLSHTAVTTSGTMSHTAVTTSGTISLKAMTRGGTILPKAVTTDGTTSHSAVTTDRSVSPKFMSTDGTSSPEHPECSEEEEDDDEDDNRSSSLEEDAEEEEDLEEEEPQFHTNPLFQSRGGAVQVPVYRLHSAALQPLLITEGDSAAGGTREGWGCPPSPPTPLGCHPAGGDVGSTAEQGPPGPPDLALSNPPDLPPRSGDLPHPLRLQPERGYQAPHRPPATLELIPGGADRDGPGPGYPPGVTSGDDQDLPLPRPPTPPKPPLGGGYQPPTRPLPAPDLPHGRGYPIPPPPPDLPQRRQYQKPSSPSYQPMRGGYQPFPSPLPPLDHPQTPSLFSPLSPWGPPRPGVLGVSQGSPPMPGHGCARLPASPGASCPGGEVAQGAPPATPPPHPAMEELPPETGEEPPPDPPASTHGCPPGGAAVTPVLANGGQGRRGEAQRLATRLFHLDGFKRSQVAAFLRKNNDFSGMVAQEYLDFFQFGGQTLDQALRSFLQALVLTGETQERERILSHFSRRYHHCNPGAFPSPDAVHSLTCAIMLLNTDLHGQRLGRAMTSAEFVANLSGMMDGQDFPREQLKALYSSIRSEKLAWAADEEEEEEEAGRRGSLASPSCKKSNPFLELPGGSGAVACRGWLTRKVLAEADGKKTPWGRRGWKSFQAVLKGTVLYFLKPGGRTGVPRRPSESSPLPAPQEEGGAEAEEPLGIHHALAERDSKYTKRPNVFRLQTADWRVFLFQAPTPEEMFSWISRINLVAALFSSPAFPAAVGSQCRFVRPILPAAPSRSPPEEQHRSHEAWMERVAQELLEHQRNLPDKRGRARDLDEYRLKKEYLLYERRRYETYMQMLETWINIGARDLEEWEAQAGPVVAPLDLPTLTKAHSSPSLVAEPPTTPTVRVKRNISERRTVRKIVPKRNKNLL